MVELRRALKQSEGNGYCATPDSKTMCDDCKIIYAALAATADYGE